MKVLFIIREGTGGVDAYAVPLRDMYALCTNMGYEIESVSPPSNSTYLQSIDPADYEFIVYPDLRDSYIGAGNSFYDGFDVGVPVFCPQVSRADGTGNFATLVGVDHSDQVTAEPMKIDCTNGLTMYLQSITSQVAVGQEANTTMIGYNTAGTAANMALWKYQSGTKAPVYCAGGFTGFHQCFPALLQFAINDGAIGAPPQKLISIFDIDDIPYASTVGNPTTTLADCQAIYDMQVAYNMPVTWGLKTNANADLDGQGLTDAWYTIPQDQKDFVALHSNGGLVANCTHNHNWEWDMGRVPESPPIPNQPTTKAEMDAQFRLDVAKVEADGIDQNISQTGYIYAPVNKISDEMTQLGSPDISILSSPNNDTVQAGYGWLAGRLDDAGARDAGLGSYKQEQGIRVHRSQVFFSAVIRMLDQEVYVEPDSPEEIDLFSWETAYWYSSGMAYRCSHYWHGANFYINHDGGNAPGLKIMTNLGQWSNFLTDTHSFESPTAVVGLLEDNTMAGYIGIKSGDVVSTIGTSSANDISRAISAPESSTTRQFDGTEQFTTVEAWGVSSSAATPREMLFGVYEFDSPITGVGQTGTLVSSGALTAPASAASGGDAVYLGTSPLTPSYQAKAGKYYSVVTTTSADGAAVSGIDAGSSDSATMQTNAVNPWPPNTLPDPWMGNDERTNPNYCLVMAANWVTNGAKVALDWTDNSDNEVGFNIYRVKSVSQPTNWGAVYETVGADVVTYSDPEVLTSGTWWYRVTAYNSGGESSPDVSNIASVVAP